MARPEKRIPGTLEEAVAQLKRDPSHPVHARVDGLETELSNRRAWASLLVALLSCGGTSASDGALAPCQPLEAREVPTTVGALLGVGQGSGGVLYVVEQEGSDHRLFVSSGTELRRVRISGSGTLPNNSVVLSVSEHQPPFRLKLEGAGTPALRMGLWLNPDPMRRDFTVGVEGETLVVRRREALNGLVVRNLEGAVHTEYLAQIEDGRRLLVVRPEDDGSYTDFRVFVGTPERMDERAVTSVLRERDGGTTHIRFALDDGTEALAYFPTPLRPEAQAMLTVADTVLQMTVERGQAPTGFQFFCR